MFLGTGTIKNKNIKEVKFLGMTIFSRKRHIVGASMGGGT